MSDLYRTMESNQTIPPLVLLQVLHQAFPRFAEKVEGHYMQQVNYISKYNKLAFEQIPLNLLNCIILMI